MGELLLQGRNGNALSDRDASDLVAQAAEQWVAAVSAGPLPVLAEGGMEAADPGRTAAIGNPQPMGSMEQRSQDQVDDQQRRLPPEGGRRQGDMDVRTEVMNREKRDEALAWAQAYRLIRGGVVDEVVEFIEGSQFTIELLLQMLRDAACRRCETQLPAEESCDFCNRREELLAELA